MEFSRIVLPAFAAVVFTATANAQMEMQSPIPGIERQCVLNHPFQADIAIAITGVDKDKPPVAFAMPGQLVRDADGRQKINMSIRLPQSEKSDEPAMDLAMIFDPPAGKVAVLVPQIKKIMTREMAQVHCAPQPTEPDFTEITKQGGKVTPLGVENIGDLKVTGYHITMARPGKDGKPAQLEMEFWTDLYQAIPVRMTVKAGEQFSMEMKFTNVRLVAPAVAAFAIPEGYSEMKMPTPEQIQGLTAAP